MEKLHDVLPLRRHLPLLDEGDDGERPLLGYPVVAVTALVVCPGEGLDPSIDNLDLFRVVLHDLSAPRGGEVDMVLLDASALEI